MSPEAQLTSFSVSLAKSASQDHNQAHYSNVSEEVGQERERQFCRQPVTLATKVQVHSFFKCGLASVSIRIVVAKCAC